jgi:phosphoglycolate phosphatase
MVFDLDGTLVDTAPDLMASLNAVLAEEGLAPITLATTRSMIGGGARALLARGFAASGVSLAEPNLSRLFERFIDIYRSRIARESRPFPGAAEALETLSGQGARLAVCTNKRTGLSVELLDALGLARWFAAIVGADGVPAPKPDPRHVVAAIERAGGRIERSVMVGDSRSDALAARAAAVPLVLVDFGYSDVPASSLRPDVLISHFDALPTACARLLGLARPCPAAVAGI